jgi:hypothetical protein
LIEPGQLIQHVPGQGAVAQSTEQHTVPGLEGFEDSPPAAPVARPLPPAPRQASLRTSELKPRHVLKAVRARIAEIKLELKNHRRLQRELAQLERVLDAAKKPVAIVKPIDSSRQRRAIGDNTQ